MPTTPVYDQLLAEVTDRLERQVLDILLDNPGRRITRQEFVMKLFGYPPADLANSTEDRQVRECIERLRAKDWPIVSSSGEAGYQIEDDEEKIREFAAEQSARAEHNRENAQAAYRWLPKAKAIQEARRSASLLATQPGLF